MIELQGAPRLRRHWLHNSGGLIWHLHALRYRTALWQDFRQVVAAWLKSWQPPGDKLIIVGPSAGYTLDRAFLQRWREIVVLEPDPLARWLLRRHYPEVRWHFVDLDVLGSAEGVDLLAQHFGQHAILFSNVLGQVMPREEEKSLAWRREFRKALATQHWASYHDVISTARAPDTTSMTWSGDGGLTLDEVLGHFWHGGELELVDHCTLGLGAGENAGAAYCIWPLRPRQYHLVEWLSSRPPQCGPAPQQQ